MARRPEGVELIISAKDESEKTFAEVISAFKELEKAAKGGAGLSDLFVGLEKRLEILAKRQETVNKALGDTKSIQKSLDAANKFTDALEDQEKAATKAQQRLSRLEAEFAGIEAAANAARQPSERLVESLAKQESRQQQLAQSIAETTEAIRRSNAALNENAGVDDKAAAAIARQEKAVIAAGQAWRNTTQQIKSASESIRGSQAERDTLTPLRDQAAAKLKELQSEFQRVQAAARAFQRSAGREDSGGAVQSLARGAQQRLAELRKEIEQQKTVQVDLTRQINSANSAITKQTKTLDTLLAKAKQQRATYVDLKNSLAEFSNTAKQEGAARQAADIDRLQKSLAQLQATYDQTTAKVKSAQQAIAAASAPDPKALSQRDAYQKRIAEALESTRREQAELARLRAEFNQAGVSAAALASRQRELDQVTTELTQEQAKLRAQTKALEGANRGAADSGRSLGDVFRRMGKDTRQSLSYLQRIRGELLSIAATYTGLYAVGGAVRSIYDASVQLTRAEARIGSAFEGDTEAVAKEIAFVRAEADRLKISFEVALDQYSKFLTAIPKGTLPLEQIRFTFSGVAEAARVAGLSNDDLQGVFNALSQIASKGALSLEELRQQLGDRLPGALERTARGLGLTSGELVKMVSQGQVSSEAIVLLANELRRDFGGELDKSLKSANASMADFQNAVFDLRLELANSGFIDVLIEGLREATDAIKSPEFRRGARDFAKLLGEIIQVGVELTKNFDKVKTVLQAVLVVMAARTIINFVTNIYSAGTGLKTLAASLGGANTGAGKLVGTLGTLVQRLTLVASVASASFAFGTYLNSQSAEVQKFGVSMVAGFKKLFVDVETLWDKFLTWFETRFDRMEEIAKGVGEFFSNPLQALQGHAFGPRQEKKDPFAEIEKNAAAAKAAIDDIAVQMFQDIDAEFAKREGKPQKVLDADAVKAESDKIKKEIDGLLSEADRQRLIDSALGGSNDNAEQKLAALRQKVADALAKIDAEIQEKSADTLEQRLEAIRVEYAKLQRQIEQAGGDQAFPKAQSSIDQIVAIKQVAETEKEINRLIQERRQAIAIINELNELGSITVEEATARINDQNAKLLPQLNAALAVAKNIASTIDSAPINQSVDAQAQVVGLEMQRAQREQLMQLEQQINQTMAVRAERIQTINALVQAGTLNEYQGKMQIIELNRQTNEQLDDTILKAQQMAASLGDAQLVERLKQVQIELTSVKDSLIDVNAVQEDFASGLTGAFESFITGAASAKDAFKSFAVDFLRQIARMITQALILRAIQGAMGGGAAGGATTGASVAHTGGIVGQLSVRRQVPVMAFANAVKYHTGGVAGLKPDEVPTVLQRGEEVLTADDPRHRNNGGMGGNPSPIQLKIVNTIDSVSVMKEAMNSSEGVKVLVNTFQANKSTFKSVLT